MKKFNVIVLFILFSIGNLDGRTWTDINGNKLEASLISIKNDWVYLKRHSDGDVGKIRLSKLSKYDRSMLNIKSSLTKRALDNRKLLLIMIVLNIPIFCLIYRLFFSYRDSNSLLTQTVFTQYLEIGLFALFCVGITCAEVFFVNKFYVADFAVF